MFQCVFFFIYSLFLTIFFHLIHVILVVLFYSSLLFSHFHNFAFFNVDFFFHFYFLVFFVTVLFYSTGTAFVLLSSIQCFSTPLPVFTFCFPLAPPFHFYPRLCLSVFTPSHRLLTAITFLVLLSIFFYFLLYSLLLSYFPSLFPAFVVILFCFIYLSMYLFYV